MTAITPPVAKRTANIRFPSHGSLYILTVKTYAKNAFAFQMAATSVRLQNSLETSIAVAGFYFSTYGARETAQNQSKPGRVRPTVISPNMVANLGHGNLASSVSVEFPAKCRFIARDRPLM
jgi:hypothetical protein